jgi:hypothetical protein
MQKLHNKAKIKSTRPHSPKITDRKGLNGNRGGKERLNSLWMVAKELLLVSQSASIPPGSRLM